MPADCAWRGPNAEFNSCPAPMAAKALPNHRSRTSVQSGGANRESGCQSAGQSRRATHAAGEHLAILEMSEQRASRSCRGT